jgi:NifB/MoaA-like Fe-S oxidoreductase
MMALFEREFSDGLNGLDNPRSLDDTLVITGEAACGFIKGLVDKMRGAEVMAVKNRFFGYAVTVAGLLTGHDIVLAVKHRNEQGKNLKRLLIPRSALRAGEDVFLDGMSLSDVAYETGMNVAAVDVNGEALIRALLPESFNNFSTSR